MLRKPKRYNPRDNDAYKAFRLKVLKRDKHKCQMPGCNSRRRLQVHHIVRYADSGYGRLNPDNGITLCFNHHNSIKDKEIYYAPIFVRIVGENNAKNNKGH